MRIAVLLQICAISCAQRKNMDALLVMYGTSDDHMCAQILRVAGVFKPFVFFVVAYHTVNIFETQLQDGNLRLHSQQPGVYRSKLCAKAAFCSLPAISSE